METKKTEYTAEEMDNILMYFRLAVVEAVVVVAIAYQVIKYFHP